MHYSDSVMADVDQWCPDVQCGAVLVTVNQRLARHYQRRYDAWQLAQGNEYWESPAILSWRSWLLQLHDDALCEGVIDLPVISAALDERLWRQAVARECANSARALLDMDAAAQQAQAAWVIQHAWHCYAGDNEHYSVDQKAYQQWSLTFRQLCHQHHVIDDCR